MSKIILLLTVLLVSILNIPAVAQDTCDIAYADLPFETATHLRGRDERIRNLIEIMEEVSDNDIDDTIYELMYWAAMADSARVRADEAGNTDYPDCETYETLDTIFLQTIDDVYAMSVQTSLIEQGKLSDFQVDNVRSILSERITAVAIGTQIWISLYDELK